MAITLVRVRAVGFLQLGDRVVAVDGIDVRGLPYADIIAKLQRPVAAAGVKEFGRLTVQRTHALAKLSDTSAATSPSRQ